MAPDKVGARQDAAFAQLAQLASGRGELGNALEFIARLNRDYLKASLHKVRQADAAGAI